MTKDAIATLHQLDGALCNYLNAITDPFEPKEAWDKETEANFAALSKAYDEAHRSGLMTLTLKPSILETQAAEILCLKAQIAQLQSGLMKLHATDHDRESVSEYNRGWEHGRWNIRKGIAALMNIIGGGWNPTHRHVKRGSEYREIARGELQTDTAIEDYTSLVAYHDKDGNWWFRPVWEFEDGRFAAIETPAAAPESIEPDPRDQIIRELVMLHMQHAKHLPETENQRVLDYLKRKDIAPSPFR